MNISIVGSRGYPSTYGGFETFVRVFAPFACGRGHDVTVYSRGRPLGARLVDGIRVIGVPGYESKSASTLSHGLTSFLDMRFRCPDVALVLNTANGFFLPFLRVPSVVNPDGLEWRRAKWGPIGRSFFFMGAILTAIYADELIVDSTAIGRYWKAAFYRDSTFIPYGTYPVKHPPTKRLDDLGLPAGGYLLIVARLVPENNVELALEAFRLAAVDVPLVIVGDANYRSPTVRAIEAAMAATGAPIKWLGRVADQRLLAELWSNCLMYIHGHSVGGTNPALVQAMGYSSGPVAFRTPFNRETLGTERRLYQNANDLAEFIHDAYRNPNNQASWAKRLAHRASQSYDWDDVCDRYLSVLEVAAAAHRKSGH